MGRTYTHPEVYEAVRDGAGWADPCDDPTRIDWPERQARAFIPFRVVDGRPVNPCESTGIRYGRNRLGHWGEQPCADPVVTARVDGHRYLLMVQRGDGGGWALPGGYIDPGETPRQAAIRELHEETGLDLRNAGWIECQPRYVPDRRGSDEAWMVTVPCLTGAGTYRDRGHLPAVAGGDDAAQAAWILADSYSHLLYDLYDNHGGELYAAHRDLLADLLD